MIRPAMLRYASDPVMLHELLHAYHARLMPNGFENRGIEQFYKDAYALKNHREFFAVTASIFLAGNDAVHEPKTRAILKEKQPDYFKYLVGLFGFDPDASNLTPVASAN
jgi:Mlc titration factor MtfA (ptsG expression regulator)